MTTLSLDRSPNLKLPGLRPTERQTQSTIADALSVHGALPDDCFWTAIPGGDGKVTLTPGYRPGAPDLLFVYRGKTVFIEMKREVGRIKTSDNQKLAHELIERAGAQAFVARNLADVVAILREDLKVPVRVRVQ